MTIDVITAARRRTRRLLLTGLAGVGLLAPALCSAAVFVASRHSEGATVPAASQPVRPQPTPTGAATLVLPANVTWVGVAGVALPISATAGPREQHNGLAAGFAHTPAGALLAAVHVLVRSTPQVGSAVFAPTLDRQVVGRYAAAMRTAVAADYRDLGGEQASGAAVGSLPAALAGGRLISYTDTAAVLDLLTTAVDATGAVRFAATTVTMAWTGRDWALIAPPQGRWDSVVRAVTATEAAAYAPLALVR